MKKKGAAALQAIKAHKLPRALLLVGPDAGLLDLMAQDAIAAHRKRLPGLSIERADDAELKAHPERLSNWLGGASLFGDVSLVHLKLGGETQAAEILTALATFSAEEHGAVLLIEMPKINKKGKLATWFEQSTWALYLETYEAEAAALSVFAQNVAKDEGVRLSSAAMDALLAVVAHDYASVRAEVQKLALYVGAGHEIDEEAIDALASDSRSVVLDDVLDAAFGGDMKLLAQALPLCVAQGVHPVQVVNGLARRAKTFYHIRGLVEDGAGLMEMVADRRFGVHFKRQANIAAQLRLWSRRMLASVIIAITRLDAQLKQGGMPAEAVLDHFLSRMAQRMAKLRRA